MNIPPGMQYVGYVTDDKNVAIEPGLVFASLESALDWASGKTSFTHLEERQTRSGPKYRTRFIREILSNMPHVGPAMVAEPVPTTHHLVPYRPDTDPGDVDWDAPVPPEGIQVNIKNPPPTSADELAFQVKAAAEARRR